MPRRFSRTHLLGALLTLAAVLLLLGVFLDKGSRGEFDPFSLTARHRSQWLLPLVEVPVYHTAWESTKYELPQYLVDHGYWMASPGQSPRYLLMYDWNEQWRDGQTELYAAMNMHTSRWIELTQSHPDIAFELWPRVLAALRTSSDPLGDSRGLMFMALTCKNSTEFLEAINAEQRLGGLKPLTQTLHPRP